MQCSEVQACGWTFHQPLVVRTGLCQSEPPLMCCGDVVLGRRWDIRHTLFGTRMNEQGKNISADAQRHPILQRGVISNGRVADAASLWRMRELRQPRKWWPIFEVPIQRPSAHGAALQIFASRDFVRKPMQAIGRVRRKLLQAGHFADFRRNPNKTTAVQNEVLHRFQSGDTRWQRNYLRPLLRRHFPSWGKLLTLVVGRRFDQLQETFPGGARGVLFFRVQLQFRPLALAASF